MLTPAAPFIRLQAQTTVQEVAAAKAVAALAAGGCTRLLR